MESGRGVAEGGGGESGRKKKAIKREGSGRRKV